MKISYIFYVRHIVRPLLNSSSPGYFENYDYVVAVALIAEGVNSKYNRTLRPIAPPRALCAFQTNKIVLSRFLSLTTVLKIYC